MKFVGMQEVVFDDTNVAFPGLGNCHGIVYVNNLGLFAYHLSGNPRPNRTAAFANFVSTHPNGGGPGLALYGYCPTNRHPKGDKAHKTELKLFAAALNYTGKIRGHRWNVEQLHWTTTFVDVFHNQGNIMCSIEGFDDFKENGPNPSPANHKSVWIGPTAPPFPIAKDEVTLLVSRKGRPSFVRASEL
jgi:hypothetical protein